MHNPSVRNWIFFTIAVLIVIFARASVINLLFSIWAGGWVMAKLFERIYKIIQSSTELTKQSFLSYSFSRYIALDLFYPSLRKQAFWALIWWDTGFLAAIATYYILKVLLIS